MEKIYKIYLDAGHGKYTAGKHCPNKSVTEWELNDRVCKFVANNLAKYNCNVYRCDDTTGETDPTPAINRLIVAEEGGADICISVHHNIAGDGSFYSGENATGVEVFVAPDHTDATREFASKLLGNMVQCTGMRNRGLKTAHLGMCTSKPFPTVLVEGGFMNNKNDLAYITSDKGVKAYAKAISSTLISFLGLTKDFPGSALEQKEGSSTYIVSTAYDNMQLRVYAGHVLANAIEQCNKRVGYKVFDDKGNVVHESILKQDSVNVKFVKVGAKGNRNMTYGQTLKMRSLPDSQTGAVIREIPYNTKLALISKDASGFWLCRTMDGEAQGYLHSAYLIEL